MPLDSSDEPEKPVVVSPHHDSLKAEAHARLEAWMNERLTDGPSEDFALLGKLEFELVDHGEYYDDPNTDDPEEKIVGFTIRETTEETLA